MIKIYYLKKAKFENGFDKYVIIDCDYNIYEPTLIYTNYLYTSFKINTIYTYLTRLVKYLNFLAKKGLKFDEVKPYIVPIFIDYLQGNKQTQIKEFSGNISNQTINYYLTSISNFYKFIEDYTKVNDLNPFLYEKQFHPGTIKKTFLHHAKISKFSTRRKYRASTRNKNNINKTRKRKTKQEIEKFREVIDNYRDRLMFDILYLTGIRISELLNLKIYDFTQQGEDGWGKIYIVNRNIEEFPTINIARDRQVKTGEREVVVHNDLINRLDYYITNVRAHVDNEDFLFVSRKGNKGCPITRCTINKHFRKYSQISGVKITPHMLRHTHITELTEAGFDPLFIRLRIGHSSVVSTMVYQHPSLNERAKAYNRYLKSL